MVKARRHPESVEGRDLPVSSSMTFPCRVLVLWFTRLEERWNEIQVGRLEERWNEIQVGRLGSYSVERLESFDHYCTNTSRTRVVLVCLLTPLPPLVMIILLECMPLRSPSNGWDANWVFWIRLSLLAFIMCFAGMSQMVILVPDIHPTFIRRTIVSWGVTAPYVGVFMLVAKSFVFPIPLLLYVGGFLMGIYFPVVMFLVFGKQALSTTTPCHRNLQQYFQYVNACMMLSNVYPLYKVLYEFVPVAYRGIIVIFVLPLWRLGAKRFVVGASRPLEDFIPGIASMTVDFYGTLFASVRMSTAGSTFLSILFIGADVGHSLLEFREVRANANIVFGLLQNRHASSERFKRNTSKRRSFSSNQGASNLMALILAVTRDPSSFHISSFENIRLRACFPHAMTSEQEAALQILEARQIYKKISPPTLLQPNKQSLCRRWILPRRVHVESIAIASAVLPSEETIDPLSTVEIFDATIKHNAASGQRSKTLVQQGLQLLFHCEYLVLVEYVECIVPLIYLLFKLTLENLPNVVFYPGGAGNFELTAALNVLVFALLELGSLITFNMFLERKFAYSPLYQLAFVLETQFYLVQPILMIEVVFLLQYELEHYGIDFTFQFKWLH